MNRMADGIERTHSRVPRVACMSDAAAKRCEAKQKALARVNGAELVTLDCRITLTRDQWEALARKRNLDLIALQVVQQYVSAGW